MLGDRIRRVREALGLSQHSLSKLLGSGRPATVSNWERNETKPERGTLRLIADLTSDPRGTLVWLESGSGEMPAIGKGSASGGVTRGVTVGKLPAIPDVAALDDPARVKTALTEYLKRIASLAALDQTVPAYQVLEGAAMLLKLYDDYAHLNFRLEAILRELPLLVFELDPDDHVVQYHPGGREELRLPIDQYMGKPLVEVMPVLGDSKFTEILATVRENGPRSFSGQVVPFKDKDRHYNAVLWLLPDRHVLVFVRRAEESRRQELGLGGKMRRRRATGK